MFRSNRSVSIVFIVGLLVLLVSVPGFGLQDSKVKKTTGDSGIKEIVGKWQGRATGETESEVYDVSLDLRAVGDKIAGSLYSQPAGDMKVTDVSYVNGKWGIICVSSEGVEAKISCSIKNGKLVGEWSFGDGSGKLEFARAEKSSK